MATDPIRDLVSRLVAEDVYFFVDGTELKYCARRGALQEADRRRVREHKTAIIEYLCKLQQVAVEEPVAPPPIDRVERDIEGLALSHGQRRLWFLHQSMGPNAVYSIPLALRLRGEIDARALVRSLEELHRRHESLRTRFKTREDGSVVQVIEPPGLELELEAVSAAEAQSIAHSERFYCFDLASERLCRIRLLRETGSEGRAGDYVLLVTMHQSVSDAWSLGIFLREFVSLYRAFSKGEDSPLAPLPIQYGDYAQWQRRWLQGAVLEQQVSYWREQLKGLPPLLQLPTDRPRPAEQTFRGSMEPFAVSAALTERLQALSREQGVTLYMTLLSAFAMLLSRYSGQQDIAVATLIANRTRAETEGVIGFFANTLVMRHDLSGDPRFVELLERTRAMALQAYAHQDVPFELLVEELNPQRSASHPPLFQVMFVLQNVPLEALELPDLSVQPLDARRAQEHDEGARAGTARFDVTLNVQESSAGLVGDLEYNTDLFERSTIRRMSGDYARLLEAIAAAPQSKLSRLDLPDEHEKPQLLPQWHGTARAYPQEKCIHELFEAKAEQAPDRIALVFDGQSLTYSELDARANQLAHHLIERGVGPGTRVALCLERSLEMSVGLLGILKAGGAYVPLEPSYPLQRLTYMMADSAPVAILTHSQVERSVREQLTALASGAPVLDLLADAVQWKSCRRDHPGSRLPALTPAHVAYLIYTSGSTGQPKGVMVAHRGLVNRLWWMQHSYQMEGRDVVLQKTPYSFDVSVWEFLWPLMVGAKLVMARPDGHKDPQYLIDVIRRQQITVMHFVPSMLKAFLDAEDVSTCTSLSRVVCSGEALPGALARRFMQQLPHVDLENLYGPTEATIDVTAWSCIDTNADTIPIGQPIANTQIYVLDATLQPLPSGVPGELYIGGVGLAVGYQNRPGLTAERFVPSSYALSPGERLYRTGDLARWLPDGSLEYLGRVDHQVKIRGFRIELGEIESVLLAHAAVRDAVVVAREESGDKRLVGYVVAKSDAPADDVALIHQLRSRLREQLPDYMVPSALVMLDSLPLTANGKLDRKALPAPEQPTDAQWTAPEGVTEELLAELWCVVLKQDRVGRHASFFELGGHSLLATQLASRIRQTFSTDLPLRELFEHPTLSSQASAIERKRGASARPELAMGVVSREQPLALSYAQQRLWFLHQYMGPNAVYNMPLALRLQGEVDEAALVRSLQVLWRRHESLRTRFAKRDGDAVQVIDPPELELDVEVVSAAEATVITRSERLHRFDLSSERLCRVRLLRETGTEDHAGDCVLLVTMHHSVSDGWSLGILFRELASLYRAYVSAEESPLAPLPIQYADYAQWQRRWLQGEVLEEQLSYWREQLSDLPPLLTLPTDRPRPAEQTFHGSTERFAVSAVLTGKLQALSRDQGVTLYMTLLSAFAVLLGRYAGQRDVAVGTPIANRTRRETEGLIGFFVNTLVMRHDLSGDPRFVEMLKRTREVALQAYAHQDVPFEQLVEELNPERSTSHSPLFQVMFILQNMPFEALELPGLAMHPVSGDEGETSRFDLTLSVQESPAGLLGVLEYNTDLFERATIRKMLEHYVQLLEAVAATPQSRLSQLEMLGEAEKRQQLFDWNATTRPYPHEKCIHELFEAQVSLRPDAIALVHEGSALTYGELNRRANALAHQLMTRGVGPEVRVGLCTPRSMQMVIGVLGILKAGGCYVPLDPDHPRKRLEYLLEDAQIDIVVTEPSVAATVTGRELLLLTEGGALAGATIAPLEDVKSSAPGLCPDHPAYLIYTSASTGAPKGVLGLHRSIVNRVHWLASSQGIGADEVLCQKTSMGFVDHVAEIFQALSAGVPLVIISPSLLQEPGALLRELDERRVTQLTLVPSLLKMVLEADSGERARWLKSIHSSGEALHLFGLERLTECFPQARLFNIYGSTEMGADVTCQEVAVDGSNARRAGLWAPMGKGIDNTQAYILDGDGQVTVSGAVGELHVGGVCLSRGYFRRAGFTAEKFVPSAFARTPGERLYRTGDLARWLPDGTLEYLGRADHQVKVRGFRIELGEIESVLLTHEAVRDAVVVANGDLRDKRLVGYVVAKLGLHADEVTLTQALRSHLQEQLPAYMVPSILMVLDSLPLTATGKADRKSLPAPGTSAPGQEYEAPLGDIEVAIASIWQDLLCVERVGRQDNFFGLGGHSLLAVQVRSRIYHGIGIEIPLFVIFNEPTLAALAQRVEAAGSKLRQADEIGGQDDFDEGIL